MVIVLRILMVIVGYVLACVAASIVLTIGTLSPQWDDFASSGLPPAAVWAIVAVGAPIIAAVAMMPVALVIALAEGFAWRSIVVYAALGGALALALSYGIDLTGDTGEPETYFAHEREVLAAAGITGGLVYWLFAGRRAGAWK